MGFVQHSWWGQKPKVAFGGITVTVWIAPWLTGPNREVCWLVASVFPRCWMGRAIKDCSVGRAWSVERGTKMQLQKYKCKAHQPFGSRRVPLTRMAPTFLPSMLRPSSWAQWGQQPAGPLRRQESKGRFWQTGSISGSGGQSSGAPASSFPFCQKAY